MDLTSRTIPPLRFLFIHTSIYNHFFLDDLSLTPPSTTALSFKLVPIALTCHFLEEDLKSDLQALIAPEHDLVLSFPLQTSLLVFSMFQLYLASQVSRFHPQCFHA